jgi:N-acetylmuramoyl-L-alanine amidase
VKDKFFIRPRRSWSNHVVDLQSVPWRMRRRIERVHHTADNGVEAHATVEEEYAYLRRIEEYHIRTRGYKAIGYNYLVFPSGRVYEGRGFGKLGAHTLGHNTDVGVCFVGNFQHQEPTEAALRAERKLRRRLRLHGVRLGKREPHRETFPTSCPGDNIMRELW